MCVCVCVCVCEPAMQPSQVVRASAYELKVVCSIPAVVTLVAIAVVSLSKKLYLHCFSLPSCINRDLVLTREAAHPAVTSMDNWREKQMSNCCPYFSGAHTITLGQSTASPEEY